MLHDPFGVSASFSVSHVSCKVTIGSDFVTGISRRMRGPCEGYLFPGIFMHQLLPDRTSAAAGTVTSIVIVQTIFTFIICSAQRQDRQLVQVLVKERNSRASGRTARRLAVKNMGGEAPHPGPEVGPVMGIRRSGIASLHHH